MRILVLVVGTCVWLGFSGHLPSPAAIHQARVGDLMAGILDDVGAILTSFSGGLDDPKGPVRDQGTLKSDSGRLDSATRKADQLANELSRLENQTEQRGH